MFRMQTTCPHCRGRGTVITDKCSDCRGNGRIAVKRKLSVKLPAGIHDGQAVRVPGEGEPPPPEASPTGSGVRGDLHVVVRVAEHEHYERDGDDLLMSVPMSFTQLALGCQMDVQGIDGTLPLLIPAGTQHGTVFRISSAGLPNLRSGRRGDLVAIAQLVVPRKLTDEQKKLLNDFATTEKLEVGNAQESTWEKIKRKVKRS
jgi:molecular chaperone DnaJ